MITSTEGGLWVNPTIGLMSKSLGLLVVVKVYLCMRDAKNRNNSVNAKDFPRQSLLPEKNSNIFFFSGMFLSKWLMFENIEIYFCWRNFLDFLEDTLLLLQIKSNKWKLKLSTYYLHTYLFQKECWVHFSHIFHQYPKIFLDKTHLGLEMPVDFWWFDVN